jgi:hypothetical protein
MVHSRDVEGGVGPEVGSGNSEALIDLVLSGSTVVLDVAGLGLDVVGVEIGDCGDIRVCNEAVVALVVIVGEDLPVEVPIHIPSVVEAVVFEIVVLESGLLVDAFEVVLPGNLRGLAGVQVHPDKAIAVEVGVSGEEIAGVECTDIALQVSGDDELVAGRIILHTVTGVGDTVLVGGEKPFSAEDRSLLKLVHGLRCVPGSRKSSDRRIVFLCWGWSWGSSRAEVIPQEGHCEYRISDESFVIKRRQD